MHRFWVPSLLVSLCACGGASSLESLLPDASPGADAQLDAVEDQGSAVAIDRDDALAEMTTDAGSFDLTVDVVRWTVPRDVPAEGAHVLVEGNGWSTELLTDSRGHAVTTVDRHTGPWDVTVAQAGHRAISILGVTGAITGLVHLGPIWSVLPAPIDTTRRINGAIQGRISSVPGVSLFGRAMLEFIDRGGTYTGSFHHYDGAPNLHLLALDWPGDQVSTPPLNAVWVDLVRTGSDLTADIVFPSPARAIVHTVMQLDTPTTGAVVSGGLKVIPDQAFRNDDGYYLSLGTSRLEPRTGKEGRFDWLVDSLDGDMAPELASTSLSDDLNDNIIIVEGPISSTSVVTVPPADTLDAAGSDLDTLTLTWSAAAYSRVGASLAPLVPTRGSATWFAYSFSGGVLSARHWPHLPRDVSLGDIGFDDGGHFDVNVFAITNAGTAKPWDFSHSDEKVALVRAYGPFSIPKGAGGAKPDGGI